MIKNRTLLLLILISSLYSCTKSTTSDDGTTDGNWVTRNTPDYSGSRTEAVAFTIGDKAYMGTGYNGTTRLTDFWSYDPQNDYWHQEADVPGGGRSSAVGFSIPENGKGYIGTGYDGLNFLSDFYEYDPGTNTWTQKHQLSDDSRTYQRRDAAAFGLSGKGYIVSGYSDVYGYMKDFWEYDPAADTWTSKSSYRSDPRQGAVAFVYNGKAYFGTGESNGSYPNDFWMYDPSQPEATAWTKLKDIANTSDQTYDDNYAIIRYNAVAFVMNDKAYIGTGQTSGLLSDVWQYNFSDDTWQKKTPYEGGARTGAIGFSINNRGYLGFGSSSTSYYNNLKEFFPTVAYNEND